MTYPSNSETSKQKAQETAKPEHVKSVVNTPPRKKPSKLEEIIPKCVIDFVKPKNPELLKQRLEYSVKMMILDTIQTAMFGGDMKSAGQNMFNTFVNTMANSGHTNYNATYNNRTTTTTQTTSNLHQQASDTSVYRYTHLVYTSKIDADNVLDSLRDTLCHYGTVSCFDLYELSGVPANALDRGYGWRDLSLAEVRVTNTGWIVSLPKALPLDYCNENK